MKITKEQILDAIKNTELWDDYPFMEEINDLTYFRKVRLLKMIKQRDKDKIA